MWKEMRCAIQCLQLIECGTARLGVILLQEVAGSRNRYLEADLQNLRGASTNNQAPLRLCGASGNQVRILDFPGPLIMQRFDTSLNLQRGEGGLLSDESP